MKNFAFILAICLIVFGCSTSSPSMSGANSQTYTSPEAKAKDLTARMVSVLKLDKVQEDKVLNINVINEKLLQRIKIDQKSDLQTTKENYHRELKGVLTSSQYENFKNSFPNL